MGGYLALATRVGIVRLAWLPQAELAATVSEDFSRLASDYSSFTGGTIRNVLLRTAFEAATDGQTITDAILRRCADDEQPLRKERQSIGFGAAGAESDVPWCSIVRSPLDSMARRGTVSNR
jgi:hypothetical protein